MQIGRQIIASLIAEQVACHEYLAVQTQVQQAQDVQQFLKTKFTAPISIVGCRAKPRVFITSTIALPLTRRKKAEQTMKQELMRPELDATDFVQFNYWDTGIRDCSPARRIHLDIKHMEMAYHDDDKRKRELTRHVCMHSSIRSRCWRPRSPAPARSRFRSGSSIGIVPAITCTASRTSVCPCPPSPVRTPASTPRCRSSEARCAYIPC